MYAWIPFPVLPASLCIQGCPAARLCVLQAAANWLLETDPAQLLRQQQAWERDMQQRQLEREEVEQQKKMQKRLIVEKWVARVRLPAASRGQHLRNILMHRTAQP